MLPLRLRYLGLAEYNEVHAAMESFTESRNEDTLDEMWFVEHPPVYTQGRAGKPEHILNPEHIPVIQTNRGGQVTYHGPGQVVVYFLLDIERRKLGVRDLVTRIENAMIAVLAGYGIVAVSDPQAPGVYIKQQKIGSIGLRVSKGRTFHGLSFNVDMDLSPYQGINPCGYAGMAVTQLSDFKINDTWAEVAEKLQRTLLAELGYQIAEE